MRLDMWPVGNAGRVTQRLQMGDVAVDDVKVDDCAGRAELFDEFLFQPVICCHNSMFHFCPLPSRQEPADLLFNDVGDKIRCLPDACETFHLHPTLVPASAASPFSRSMVSGKVTLSFPSCQMVYFFMIDVNCWLSKKACNQRCK